MSALLPSFLRGQPNPFGGERPNTSQGNNNDRSNEQRRNSAPNALATTSNGPFPSSVFTNEEWSRRLETIIIPKEEINQLVMNYLVIEGYKDAAERFARETSTAPPSHLGAIADRMRVRTAIHQGDLEAALDLINDLQPDLLDSHPRLFFHLQQLCLRQLISERGSSDSTLEAAIEFSQEVLAPVAERHPECLRELERTMTLLVLGTNTANEHLDVLTTTMEQTTDKKKDGSHVKNGHLQSINNDGDNINSTVTTTTTTISEEAAWRARLANEVNQALLAGESQECESRLPLIIRALHGIQESLASKVTFPKISDYATASYDVPLA